MDWGALAQAIAQQAGNNIESMKPIQKQVTSQPGSSSPMDIKKLADQIGNKNEQEAPKNDIASMGNLGDKYKNPQALQNAKHAKHDENDFNYGGGGGITFTNPGNAPAAGGKLDSDARIKDNIDPSEEDAIETFAKAINNYTWTYKPESGEDPSKLHSGPMAQELLKVPGYQSTVVNDPRTGYLGVDTGALSLANTGTLSDLAKRLLVVEELLYTVIQGLGQDQQQEQMQAQQQPPPGNPALAGGIGGV